MTDSHAEAQSAILWRSKLIKRCKDDAVFRQAIYDKCAKGEEGLIFWLNNFAWVYEIIGLFYEEGRVPLVLYPSQEVIVRDIYKGITGEYETKTPRILEKSRDMGATWLVLLIYLWFWMFGGEGNDFLVGSQTKEDVSQLGVMSTLMEKMRFQMSLQPVFLAPAGFDLDNPAHSSVFRIYNPVTGASIIGRANTMRFGRSGRFRSAFLDEFGFWDNTDAAAWRACSQSAKLRIGASTAHGRGNHFFALRSGKAGDVIVHRLHWTQHPHKDQEWYDNECRTMSTEDIAQELDIDYDASVTGRCYESFSIEKNQIDSYEPRAGAPLILACDFNIDPMAWIIGQEQSGGTAVFFDELVMSTTTTEAAAIAFVNRYRRYRTRHVDLYGDAAGRARHVRSHATDYDIIVKVLTKAGWTVTRHIPSKNPAVAARVSSVNKMFADWEHDDTPRLFFTKNCEEAIASISATRWKRDRTGIDKSDNIEHITDSLGYYVHKRYPAKPNQATSRRR